MPILEPCDNPRVRYHSSISQHKNTLSVMKKGEWCPIAFDALDWADCGELGSHTAILALSDDIGYEFQVGDTFVHTEKFLYADKDGLVLKVLPAYYGEGYYYAAQDGHTFVNADNGALGEFNKYHLRVGENYAISDKILPAVA